MTMGELQPSPQGPSGPPFRGCSLLAHNRPLSSACAIRSLRVSLLLIQKFHHPKLSSLHRENFIWNLKSVPLLEKYLYALGQNQNREIVEQVIQLFKDEVMTNLSHFRECEYPPNQVNVFLNFSVVKFQTSRKVWRYNLALTILILCHIWSCCF